MKNQNQKEYAMKSTMIRLFVFLAFVSLLALGTAEANTLAGRDDRECEEGPAMLALVKREAGESLSCLDSYTTEKTIRTIVLATLEIETASGGETEQNAIVVIDARLTGGAKDPLVTRQFRITNPELFPNGCGNYLKGARVLPGSEKIALNYAKAIRTVDFSKPAAPVIQVVNDRHIPGSASTCEGYSANWGGGRDDHLAIDAAKRELTLQISSRESVEQPVEKPLQNPAEYDFYRYAYTMQCTGARSEPQSVECLDLKRAFETGVFVIHQLVRPVETIRVLY